MNDSSGPDHAAIESFIQRWQNTGGKERQDTPRSTARSDLQRHCQIHERVQATGIAPGRTN